MSAVEVAARDDLLRRRALGLPSAKSLLFTVLGEFVLPRGGRVWSSVIVDALGALGVEEKSARQALARTVSDGWLRREPAGRRMSFELTYAAHDLLREGAERIYSFGGSQDDWDGRFAIVVANAPSREIRHRLQTRLAWAGFGSLRPGIWIAAHTECEDEAERVLDDLGLCGDAYSFRADAGEIGSPGDLVREAWDLDVLERRYEDFIDTFRAVRPTGAEASFVALTRLVHEWRKFPFLDPRLPARLLPSRWSGDIAHDLFHSKHAAWSARANGWFESRSAVDHGRPDPKGVR